MRKTHLVLILAALALLVTLPASAFAHEQGDHDDNGHNGVSVLASFHIRLTGEQQVPEVDTDAFGFATVQLLSNMSIQFRLVVCDIANVTHAHIHFNATGTNGPIVIPFFDQPESPVSSADGCVTLAHGNRSTFAPSATQAGINTWTDFVNALLAGKTYVNVHTLAHPGGEIRGQLISHHHEDNEEHNHQAEE